ncbi:MAG TPA: CDP-alcohol phosphatidyltransferase [Marinobacter sp.]|nr:CDP-alcohol phosphatidyltransferase [Marinobacter sp.]
MHSPVSTFAVLQSPLRELVVAGIAIALLAAGSGSLLDLSHKFYSLTGVIALISGGLIWRSAPTGRDFGAANRVTLGRGVLVIWLVCLAPWAPVLGNWLWPWALLCLLALLLDGVDGWVARATGTRTAFGARFDMELDALFILGLCVAVLALDKAGAWVLAVGLMRYLFVAAGWLWGWMDKPLPESFRRKTVCVWQLVTLMVAILPITPALFANITLATALALLSYSFITDLLYLYQTRRAP